ncbi:MAG: twin-arginine translocation signal domain-containing protein [Candidatus Dadabacteria bacterium]|nr:MAG: twin-arginine translocation signal domain-containing protein [Candidatus Dadabacteria bacterium]
MKENKKDKENKKITRRDFIKGSGLLGGAMLAGAVGTGCQGILDKPETKVHYPLNDPDHFIYSVCLQCHTDCPIKVKVNKGVVAKIDGNPYSMQTLNPAIKYETPLEAAAKIDGGICPKGQAGIETLYDPYRVVKVLKRAGKRGENKWMVIPFEQAIKEIVDGGKLFSHVKGEEDREVPGLKSLYKLKDPSLSKKLAEDAKKTAKGEISLAEFKRKHKKHLELLINPDFPDFGPVNNQFVFLAGRIEHGRKEFAKRWLIGGFGSVNWYEHTTVCEQSHHIAYEKVTESYIKGKWSKGKEHLKPDMYESEFIIFVGTGAFEANFGPPYLSNLVTNRLVTGDLKICVVDPRLSNTAAKAWKWLPVKPGKDAAFAYSMIRWLIENKGYNEKYLRNANKAAATKRGESTFTNATWLVKIEKDGPGAFLRANELGIGSKDEFIVIKDGQPTAVDPHGANSVVGELEYSGVLNGIKVKTSFTLLKEYAFKRSFKEWAALAGLNERDVEDVCREFVRHGRKSSVEFYRGPVQHTNGYYNGQALITINILVGNCDYKGGVSKGGGHWHEDGSKPGQPFNIKKGLHPNKLTSFGVKLSKEKTKYEDTLLFKKYGYPAKRPWYPHTGNVYQEVIPAAEDGYPYPIKALFTHKGTPALSLPGGHKVIETLVDLEKIPLYFASDIVIGETSVYADYIFPDIAIWERWGTPHITPACPVKQSKVRQPTVSPLVETVKVFGEEMPCSMEAVMLAIAEKLNLPGYGKDGFGKGMDFKRMEDFYLKMVANIAAGDKPHTEVPDEEEKGIKIFMSARRHLSSAVFNPKKWEKAVIDSSGRNWWKKVIYILNRGGRYENFDVYRKSKKFLPHKFGSMFNIYVEDVALTRHSYTGERFSGIALYEPVRGYDGKEIKLEGSYPLKLITYKDIRGGQSRTAVDYWLLASGFNENYVIINKKTAEELGLKDGQRVRVISATNNQGVWDLKNGRVIPVEGTLRCVQGMRPGVVAVSWHFGHWAYGSSDIIINGQRIKGDSRRGRGLCTNAVLWLDPALGNTTLSDLIGGSASFYDTRVNVVAV